MSRQALIAGYLAGYMEKTAKQEKTAETNVRTTSSSGDSPVDGVNDFQTLMMEIGDRWEHMDPQIKQDLMTTLATTAGGAAIGGATGGLKGAGIGAGIGAVGGVAGSRGYSALLDYIKKIQSPNKVQSTSRDYRNPVTGSWYKKQEDNYGADNVVEKHNVDDGTIVNKLEN